MRTQTIAGGLFCEALPSGEFACLLADYSRVTTHLGDVPALGGVVPLNIRITNAGGNFRFAGQGSETPTTREWSALTGWNIIDRVACGSSPVLYLPDGTLLMSDCAWPGPGSQGFRYYGRLGTEGGDERVIYGWETYTSTFGLAEWTYLGDGLWIGQGLDAGGVCVRDGETLRVLAEGDCRFIRANRSGDDVAIAYLQGKGAPSVLVWTTIAELRALPALEPPAPPPYDPIVAIGRRCWFGWFTFGQPTQASRNCDLRIPVPDTPDPKYVLDGHGNRRYRFVSAPSDSDVDGLDALCRQIKAAGETVPLLGYWTAKGQQNRPPKDADVAGVELYLHKDETPAQLEQRASVALGQVKRAVLVNQCYDSNSNNSSDLRRVPPVASKLARDHSNVEGLIQFTGAGRKGGWQDHPEVQGDWQKVYEGIPGPPTDGPTPIPPDPQPPDPMPIPPHPQPPEVPDMAVQVGDLIQFRRYDAADNAPYSHGVVVTHKRDEDYLNPNHDGKTRTVIRAVSSTFPSGAGNWITWDTNGNPAGVSNDPAGPGGSERVTFSGNFMIVRPGCGKDGSGTAVIYHLVNMSQPDKAV